ncbi:redoxin domain-containing protein [Thalassobius vesicularis]|uniref:Alkyl hydroperoxide reductase C n=1 Tax=Thalassobius vesicularis TaxID=1294297 RepID=A0A4S3MBD4_9RHOB|nr:redoxin domain-containing protein [Thalassobius vesicularis]THD75784.1 redoxin domain-containing protein [Thalassobius vesicularis]
MTDLQNDPPKPVTPRRRRARWTPTVGTEVPDFAAETTRGRLELRKWGAGNWLYLFAFPSTFSSVCTTELVALAARRQAFEALGVRLMGITPAAMKPTLDWVLDLEKLFGLDIHFPIVADEGGATLRQLGLMPAEGGLASRPSLFLDPAGKLRMHATYPARMGRSVPEVLRCFEAMKDVDYSGLATPADWMPGDDLVAPKGVDAEQMQSVFGDDWSKVSDYLMVAHVKG